jgi:hypothetical protein
MDINSWNILKRQKNLVDHTPITLTSIPSPSPSHSLPFNELDGPSVDVGSSNLTPLTTSVEMQGPITKLCKGEIMTVNSRSMAIMAHQFSLTSNVHDALLLGKMDINCERKNKVKINHLKKHKHLNMISQQEFRIEVRAILELNLTC